jgi:hypothetical protein
MKVVTTVKNGAAQSNSIHPQMPRPDARCIVSTLPPGTRGGSRHVCTF